MRKMRTAEEMLAYDYDDRRRDFEFAEFLLEPGEYVFSFFWGYIYIYI